MKKLLGGLGLLTLMAFSVFTVPSQAATATKPKIVVTPKYQYDASKEVTLKGTISSVVKKPSSGMLVGEHLMLTTSSGSVDAHVGSYASRDKHLNSLGAGPIGFSRRRQDECEGQEKCSSFARLKRTVRPSRCAIRRAFSLAQPRLALPRSIARQGRFAMSRKTLLEPLRRGSCCVLRLRVAAAARRRRPPLRFNSHRLLRPRWKSAFRFSSALRL